MKADLSRANSRADGTRRAPGHDGRHREPGSGADDRTAAGHGQITARLAASSGPSRVHRVAGAAAAARQAPATPAIVTAASASGLAIIAIAIGVTSRAPASQGCHPAAGQGRRRRRAPARTPCPRRPVHVRGDQGRRLLTPALKPLGGTPPPFPRHIHLKMITSQVWVPVDNVCRTGLERGITATGHMSSSTFSAQQPGVKCPNIGCLNDPTYRLLQTLPTNPHALLAMIYRIERGHGPGPAQEAFVTIGDLLRNTIAPPKVAAALYRAAALIPGVTLVPDATDAIGRHGVAVARIGPGVDGGVREELIFSRATLQLIGERTVDRPNRRDHHCHRHHRPRLRRPPRSGAARHSLSSAREGRPTPPGITRAAGTGMLSPCRGDHSTLRRAGRPRSIIAMPIGFIDL